MARPHLSEEVERHAMVFYVPEAKAFWVGRNAPPGPLRKAQVFHFRLPNTPAGAIAMLRRQARQMLNRADYDAFLEYVSPDEREEWFRRS